MAEQLARTTKEFYALFGDVDDNIFLGFHIVFFASVLLSSKPGANTPGMTRCGCLDAYFGFPPQRCLLEAVLARNIQLITFIGNRLHAKGCRPTVKRSRKISTDR